MAYPGSSLSSSASRQMRENTLRYSDVAHFVGLSLMKSPSKLPPGKTKNTGRALPHTTIPQTATQATAETAPSQSSSSRSKCSKSDVRSSFQHLPEAATWDDNNPFIEGFRASPLDTKSSDNSKQMLVQARSLPALLPAGQVKEQQFVKPTDDALKQSQQFSMAQMRLLDQTLADYENAEQRAHKVVQKTKERYLYHQRRLDSVNDTITRLEEELRLGEEAALQMEQLEFERQQFLRWQRQQIRAAQAAEAEQEHIQLKEEAARKRARKAQREQTKMEPAPAALHTAAEDRREVSALDHFPMPATELEQVAAAAEDQADGNIAAEDQAQAGGQNDGNAEIPELSGEVVVNESLRAVDRDAIDVLGSDSGSNGRQSKGSKDRMAVPGESDERTLSNASAVTQRQSKKTTDTVRREPEIVTPTLEMFKSEKELTHFRQEVIRNELVIKGGNELKAFRAINLNGSGSICSQEFADGVKRFGVQWQQLTGLKKPRELFSLFDTGKTGVITLYNLFPSEKNKVVDETKQSTPRYWKSYVERSCNMEAGFGGAKWHAGTAEEELALSLKAAASHEESAHHNKWMKTTFRRMKFRGKSDARAREMVALHLPRGTGPEDLQGVHTFGASDLMHCKRVYSDAVLEPQRTITKAIDDLRKNRRDIHKAREQLYTVAIEPFERALKKEEVKNKLGAASGGLSLGLAKKQHEQEEAAHEEHEEQHHVQDEPAEQEQATFGQLAKTVDMPVSEMEAVFKIWMRHTDKNETIHRKNFQKLVEDLCPRRTIVENDMDAWWDQIQNTTKDRLRIDWKVADAELDRQRSLGQEERHQLQQTRKLPAPFDQFIAWWSTCEIRASAFSNPVVVQN